MKSRDRCTDFLEQNKAGADGTTNKGHIDARYIAEKSVGPLRPEPNFVLVIFFWQKFLFSLNEITLKNFSRKLNIFSTLKTFVGILFNHILYQYQKLLNIKSFIKN